MKKIFLIFFLSLLIPNVVFSQDTYSKILEDSLIVITPTQLKQTNLIFAEHKKLLQTDSIYKKQIEILKEAISVSLELDSVYNKKLNNYYTIIQDKEKENTKLKKRIKNSKNLNLILGGSSIITILLALLIK